MHVMSVVGAVAGSAGFPVALLALVAFLAGSADAAQVLESLPDDPRLKTAVQAPAVETAVDKLKEKYRRPAEIPFPKENPYSAVKAHPGRTLYFDPRLSRADKVHPLNLTDAEMNDLVAFMLTLSSEVVAPQLTQLPN